MPSARTKWVIGNWKMNGNTHANAELISRIKTMVQPRAGVRVGVCPPNLYLSHTRTLIGGHAIALGAQDLSEHSGGAFTGQVAGSMLRELGVELAIVGHSERRHGLQESDAIVAQKALAACNVGLTPVVCVGETLAERESGNAKNVVVRQLSAVIATLGEQLHQMVVAYEPVWAIGTGKTATAQDAQAIHKTLREVLAERRAEDVSILYGGSVKADNAGALLAMPDIDGALVGGAALDAEAFAAICAAAQ